MAIKVAVIAGTPVDTQMGADFLGAKNAALEILRYPVSKNPQEQTQFQVSSTEQKENVIRKILADAIEHGCTTFFVYCNSLSSSVNFLLFEKECGIKIVTPLLAYSQLGKNYDRIGVIAANNQSLAGIERALLAANPAAEVLGVSLLPVVKEVEQKTPPEHIVRKWHLGELAGIMEADGIQAFVLGCTHFPYFEDALRPLVHVPLINPADVMASLLFEPSV